MRLHSLLEEGETVEDLLRLPPDQLLLRWFNYHLKAAGHKRRYDLFTSQALTFPETFSMFARVNNFSRDVMDGENYTILLNQLKPAECSRAPLQVTDLLKRAEMVRHKLFIFCNQTKVMSTRFCKMQTRLDVESIYPHKQW
jgi:plastin-1